GFTGTGDQVGGGANPVIDPMLGQLQNNGGPTQTHALLFGSPALETGDDCVLTACGGSTPPVTTDQRDVTRPQGNHVDIGAFELQAFVVNTTLDPGDGVCNPLGTGDGCTLHEAITAANLSPGNPRMIVFNIPTDGSDPGCDTGTGVCTIKPFINLPP